jgi:CelD/BcsL family acetyltransferase involved in cellulose biosynthesis
VSDLTLEVVDDDARFAELRGDWADVAAADADPNIFLTWPWAHTWWRHFGAGRADCELHIVVVRDAQGIVGLDPLFRSKVGFGRLAVPALQRISHDSGDYGGMLLARRGDEVVALLVAHLGAQLHGRVAVVVLSGLPSDARFTSLLGDELVRHAATVETMVEQLGDACLFTDVRAGFDLARQARKHKIRQRARRLGDEHGAVTFVDHTGDTLATGLDRLLSLHDRRWDGIDQPMQGMLADPARRRFLLDAIRALDAEGMVVLLSIEVDGTPVAVELDFVHGNRLFLFKGAFDPDYAAFSPGHLLRHKVFEDGLADGVDVFDFCRGDAQYKRRWANGEATSRRSRCRAPAWRGPWPDSGSMPPGRCSDGCGRAGPTWHQTCSRAVRGRAAAGRRRSRAARPAGRRRPRRTPRPGGAPCCSWSPSSGRTHQ